MIDLLYTPPPATDSAASQAQASLVTQPSKPSRGILWLHLVTLLLFLGASLPGQAAVIYSSAKLASGAPNGISWNAYGVGFITPTNSIGFASPFRTPSFDTVANTLRVAVSLSSGDN